MNHLSWDEIWAYLDEELADPSQLRHLQDCPDCSHRVETARQAHRAIQLSLALPESLPQNEEAVARICHEISRSASQSRPLRPWRRLPKPWLASGAAVALASVLAAIFERQLISPAPHVSERTFSLYAAANHSPQQTEEAAGSSSVMKQNSTVQMNVNKNGGAQATASANNVVKSASRAGSTGAATGPSDINTTSTDRAGLGADNGSKISSTFVVNVQATPLKTTVGTGIPLADAHVAVFSNGKLVWQGLTGSSGNTKGFKLTVYPDSVLAPLYSAQRDLMPRGNATVVIWKQGYRPIVLTDVPVMKGSSGTSVLLKPAASGKTSFRPLVMEYGLHVLEAGAYAHWVQQQVIHTESANSHDAHTTTRVQVRVLDEHGRPVQHATIAVVSGSKVTVLGMTSARGWSPILVSSSSPDWRVAVPGQPVETLPQVVSVVAFKAGYAPWLTLNIPVQAGKTVQVQARIESARWRKTHMVNNQDAPVGEPWIQAPSDASAATLLAWAKAHWTTK
ncbi:MAG: hypothetical protein K6T83_10710 [Alicyclobacillus sp.]|nr:hypothetical protein [Alicyclobacillus sp.]